MPLHPRSTFQACYHSYQLVIGALYTLPVVDLILVALVLVQPRPRLVLLVQSIHGTRVTSNNQLSLSLSAV